MFRIYKLQDKCNQLGDLAKSAAATAFSTPNSIKGGAALGTLAITAAKARIIAALNALAAAESTLAAQIASAPLPSLPAGLDFTAVELLEESAASVGSQSFSKRNSIPSRTHLRNYS